MTALTVPEHPLHRPGPAPKSMGEQEIFDTVATHLLTQGQQSCTDEMGDDPAYFDPHGRACAIGCLLVYPGEYEPSMEKVSVGSLYNRNLLPVRFQGNLDLLSKLQACHDCHIPADWRERLEVIAFDFDINPDAATNFTKGPTT